MPNGARFSEKVLGWPLIRLIAPEKAGEIKSEIEILSQTFERILDRKMAIIQSLVQDLVEAEQQVPFSD